MGTGPDTKINFGGYSVNQDLARNDLGVFECRSSHRAKFQGFSNVND